MRREGRIVERREKGGERRREKVENAVGYSGKAGIVYSSST